MDSPPDFDVAEGPSDSDLRRVASLASLQLRQEQEVTRIERELRGAKEALRRTQEIDLPEAMAAANIQECTSGEGIRIAVRTDYFASATKERFPAIEAWLTEKGFQDIIKRQLVIVLGGDATDEADQVIDALRTLPCANRISIERKDMVEPNTLKSLVKERIKANEDVPIQDFNIFVKRQSYVSKAEEERWR